MSFMSFHEQRRIRKLLTWPGGKMAERHLEGVEYAGSNPVLVKPESADHGDVHGVESPVPLNEAWIRPECAEGQ